MNTEPKSTASQEFQEPLSGGQRLILFLGTYILGALIVTIISVASGRADFLFLFPSVILFLPGGVLRALEWISNHIFAMPLALLHAATFPMPANIFATLLMVLSYILFFALLIAGTTADKPRIFRNSYFVFIFWVILNAGGCLVHLPG